MSRDSKLRVVNLKIFAEENLLSWGENIFPRLKKKLDN